MNKLGMGELIIILVIAVLVLGPERMPALGRALGKAVRKVKRYVHEMTEELGVDDLNEIKKDMTDIQKDLKDMGKDLTKSIEDEGTALDKELKATEKEIQTAVEQDIPDEIPTTKEGTALEEEGETPLEKTDATAMAGPEQPVTATAEEADINSQEELIYG